MKKSVCKQNVAVTRQL